MSPEHCRHCGDAAGSNVFGLCDSCFRKSTVLLMRKEDGTYQCSLCVLAQHETSLDVHDRETHLKDTHNIESGERLQTIREHERLVDGSNHRQVGLGEVGG